MSILEKRRDFGDAKFIDSIKCIRFKEMTDNILTHKRMDSVKLVNEHLEEIELKRLNTPCK